MKGGTASGASGGMRRLAVHINPPEKSLENPRPAPSRKALLLVRAELRREGLAWCWSPVRARSNYWGVAPKAPARAAFVLEAWKLPAMPARFATG